MATLMKWQESQNQAWAGGRAPRVAKSGQAENRSQAGLQSGAGGREQAAKVLLRTDSWRQKPSQSAERQWELGMGGHLEASRARGRTQETQGLYQSITVCPEFQAVKTINRICELLHREETSPLTKGSRSSLGKMWLVGCWESISSTVRRMCMRGLFCLATERNSEAVRIIVKHKEGLPDYQVK